MRSILADIPAPTPRKMLAPRGEGRINSLASLDESRLIGRVVDRALLMSDITKQDAAFRMGYSDQSAVSRWIAGLETPQLAKLWTLGRRFRSMFLLSWADACADEGVEVRTVVTLDRRSA